MKITMMIRRTRCIGPKNALLTSRLGASACLWLAGSVGFVAAATAQEPPMHHVLRAVRQTRMF